MTFDLYAPTRFEVPSCYRKETKIFGIGAKRAKQLADQLNKMTLQNSIIVFGSAGALKTHLKPGDIFVIEGSHPTLKKTKLFTSANLLGSTEEKLVCGETSGADLVDMEMQIIWENSNEEVRKKLIFIRGVIDGLHDRFDFVYFDGETFRLKKLFWLSPKKISQLLRFLMNAKAYRKNMKQALDQLINFDNR